MYIVTGDLIVERQPYSTKRHLLFVYRCALIKFQRIFPRYFSVYFYKWRTSTSYVNPVLDFETEIKRWPTCWKSQFHRDQANGYRCTAIQLFRDVLSGLLYNSWRNYSYLRVACVKIKGVSLDLVNPVDWKWTKFMVTVSCSFNWTSTN